MGHRCASLRSSDLFWELKWGYNWEVAYFHRWLAIVIGAGCAASTWADACTSWFQRSGLGPGPDCMSRCVALPVGMSTFDCPTGCPNFCKGSLSEKLIFGASELYPSLTPAERVLAAKDPKMVMDAYVLSWKGESQCKSLYLTSQWNDESDACRHYMWAGLMRAR